MSGLEGFDPDVLILRPSPDDPPDKSLRHLFRAVMPKYRRRPGDPEELSLAVEERLMAEIREALDGQLLRLPDGTYTLHPEEVALRERVAAGRWSAAWASKLRPARVWDSL